MSAGLRVGRGPGSGLPGGPGGSPGGRSPLTSVAALVLAAGLVLGTAALSRVGLSGGDPREALLRLSWKMTGEVVEACRQRTPEELERLPVHMRNPDACEGRSSPYRLLVDVDGTRRADRVVEAPGIRGDRPIVVLEEVPVEAGDHRLRVVFQPTDSAAVTGPSVFEDTVNLAPREVLLITRDPESGHLVRSPRQP